MAQWRTTFYMPDESAMTWTGQADDHDDALAQGREHFDELNDGPLTAEMTGSERDASHTGPLSPEEIPAEGAYLYEITQESGRAR